MVEQEQKGKRRHGTNTKCCRKIHPSLAGRKELTDNHNKGDKMFTYRITGQITYNDADTEDGILTVDIDEEITVEEITVEEMSACEAFDTFLAENEQYEFYGSLTTCDVETGGKKGATYRDQNADQTINVDLISS